MAATELAQTNGLVVSSIPAQDAPPPVPAAPPAAGPQAKRRMRTLTIPDSESYDGFTLDVFLNVPWHVMELAQKGEVDTREVIRAICIRHNGWLDFDGNPYPPITDDAFWNGERAAPADLQAFILQVVGEAINELPLVRRTSGT